MTSVVYLGVDLNYWKLLQSRLLKDFDTEDFEFHCVWSDELETFQKVLLEINEKKPDIIFLDYGQEPQKVLTVARTVKRVYPNLLGVIGLWDSQSSKELILEGQSVGVRVSHIKSGEIGIVALHSMFLSQFGKVALQEWSKAESYDCLELRLSHSMKVGFVSPDYIHVEHNLIPPESPFFLRTNFFLDYSDVSFQITRYLDQNFYFNFKHASDFEISYVNEEEKNQREGEGKREWELRLAYSKEREELLRNKFLSWLKGKEQNNISKRTKLLVIDKELTIVKQADRPLDTYPFCIRFYQDLNSSNELIKKVMAGIICYQCQNDGTSETSSLIGQVNSLEGYDPFIIIFNSKKGSKEWQEEMRYERVISYQESFDLEQLLNFCESYEEREGREKSHDPEQSYHSREVRHYVDKYDSASNIQYDFNIDVKEISESYLKFQCIERIPNWTILQMNRPIEMAITITHELDEKDWKKEKMNQYFAIIHSIGETELANFRKLVNNLIHREKLKRESSKD